MKSMFKTSAVFATLLFAAFAASAQSYHLENSGRILNQSATYASVNGNGTSNSVAKGDAASIATGYVSSNPIAGGQSLALGGATHTSGSALAFNVSTGNGVGSAQSQGWSDAQTFGNAKFSNANGTLQIAGSADNGMTNAVRNGVDFGVNASTSRDGFAAATSDASFNVAGTTSQLPIAGGATVAGAVYSNQTQQSTAEAGGVSFNDGTPAGQSAATRWANGGANVSTSGSFWDPVH